MSKDPIQPAALLRYVDIVNSKMADISWQEPAQLHIEGNVFHSFFFFIIGLILIPCYLSLNSESPWGIGWAHMYAKAYHICAPSCLEINRSPAFRHRFGYDHKAYVIPPTLYSSSCKLICSTTRFHDAPSDKHSHGDLLTPNAETRFDRRRFLGYRFDQRPLTMPSLRLQH